MDITLRPEMENLPVYDAEEHIYPVKLDANEYFGKLPLTVDNKLRQSVTELLLNRYPPIKKSRLQKKIAQAYEQPAEGVVIGNGSSELLAAACYVFGGQGKRIVFPTPSFSMYPVYAWQSGSIPVPVPMNKGFHFSAEAVLAKIEEEGAELLILCNPNNPLGSAISSEELFKLLDQVNCPILVDEAYMEFYGQSAVKYLAEHPRLMVARTFSKAYGLAGARVGYLLAQPETAALLEKVLLPYHVNSLSLTAAEIVFDHRQDIQPLIDQIIGARKYLAACLEDLNGVSVLPSVTNFLCVQVENGRQLYEFLAARGIGVRAFSAPEYQQYIRVTVGSEEENKLFLQGVMDWVKAK